MRFSSRVLLKSFFGNFPEVTAEVKHHHDSAHLCLLKHHVKYAKMSCLISRSQFRQVSLNGDLAEREGAQPQIADVDVNLLSSQILKYWKHFCKQRIQLNFVFCE